MPKHGKKTVAGLVSQSSAILTKSEAAAVLRVSIRYIERAIRDGRLRAYKLSHKLVRIRRSDLEAFLISASSLFSCPETEVRS